MTLNTEAQKVFNEDMKMYQFALNKYASKNVFHVNESYDERFAWDMVTHKELFRLRWKMEWEQNTTS